MARGLTRGTIRTGVATGVAALLLGTAGTPAGQAAPGDELIWEEGTVTHIADGDTLVASLDTGPGLRGSQRVRTIGVQAPEIGECGAAKAKGRLGDELPVGSRVQTRSLDVRSNDDHSGGRLIRSLYALDREGNWYDTSRQTVSDGWLMWFPRAADSATKAEYAHNLEYRVLAEDAAAERRGLWSANLCGGSPYAGADLRVWAKYWGTEEVYVENRSGFDVNLSGWTVRDSAISGYRTLPAGTIVPAGAVRMVYRGDMNLNNLPPDNAAFEGDAVYLMDNAGPYGTGNLRAWFPYPCDPDDCRDVLRGSLDMTLDQVSDPALTKPSAPGEVTAVASTDGTGTATVTWAEPVNLGANSVTYTLDVTAEDGGAEPAPITGIGGLSRTVTGLTLGRAYTFTVTAVNGAGASDPSKRTPAVAPIGLPGAPPAPVVDVRGTSAVVSWQWPTGAAGEPAIQYSATATPAPTTDPTLGAAAVSCATTAGESSCLLDGLVAGAAYTATVTATLGSQALTSAPTQVPVVAGTPAAALTAPGTPTDVRALAGDTRAVISWTAPDQSTSGPIAGYEVAVEPQGGGRTRTCTTDGPTSCVVTGLANGTDHVATVVASIGSQTSDASEPSAPFTPYAPVTARSGGPTSAPPAADIWVGGEIVRITNTSTATVRLGGYGLWDRYSANESSTDSARYLFPAEATLGAGRSLLVHFGTAPTTKPAAPSGSAWLWTGEGTFINSDTAGDFVELGNLNKALVDCETTGTATCRDAQQVSVSSSPVGLTALASASSVTVNWGAPISRGGTPITGYTATAFDAPIGGTVIARCTAGGAARSCSFPGSMGRAYFVEVVARNAQGTSGPSWRVRAVPKTVPGAPGSVSASGTPGGINVAWTPAAENGASITRYTASAYTASTGGSPVGSCTTSNGSMGSCTIVGLQGGVPYHIDVVATNRAGNGAASSPRVSTTTGPGGAISTYSKRRVTVRWDPPAAGAAAITGYTATLYTKKSGGKKVGSCTAPSGATSCRTKKVKKRSKYYISLTTQSAAGSFTVKPRIVTGPPKKASRPKVTSATPQGRKVVITWNPPSFTGYTYLKTYKARLYSKKKGGKSRATCYAGATTTTCTTKTLKKGRYYAAVQVRNTKGWSTWSKRVTVYVR